MQNLTRITIPTHFHTEDVRPPAPHFDDEATLLAARPVVPLSRPFNRGNLRNYLLTAVILLTAALVGAIAALSIDRFQNSARGEAAVIHDTAAPATAPVSDTKSPETSEPPAAPAASPATNEEAAAAALAKPDDPKPENSTRSAANGNELPRRPSPQPRTVTRQQAAIQRPAESNSGTERPRRVADQPRDLRRIREIFEGPDPF